MVLDSGIASQPAATYHIGNGRSDKTIFVSSSTDVSGRAEVDINGRIAVDREDDDCNF